MSFLDDMLRKVIRIAGVELPERKAFNFVSGVSGVDNPATNAIDLTVTGSGAVTMAGDVTGPSGTSVVAKVNGQAQGAAVVVAAYAIDWTLGQFFTKTLGAGAQVFTFSGAASGRTITVRVTGAASTLTWPTVKWASGTPPTQTASGIDVYTFFHDGTSIYGAVVQAMS